MCVNCHNFAYFVDVYSKATLAGQSTLLMLAVPQLELERKSTATSSDSTSPGPASSLNDSTPFVQGDSSTASPGSSVAGPVVADPTPVSTAAAPITSTVEVGA